MAEVTVKVYDQNRQECGELALPCDIFQVEPRPEILNLVVRAQMAAMRAGTHQTKTRGLVSGGGNKPWKQKGTGRARAGSNRSPVWRGGAIIFGPKPRDYSFKVNARVRALALRMALSSRLAADRLLVVREMKLEQPKTRLFAALARTLELDRPLIVMPEMDESLVRAARNIPGVALTTPDRLSVLQVLKHRQLVLLENAVKPIEARFAVKREVQWI